jgi:hypothetical protein
VPGNIALATPDGSARQAAAGAVRRPRRPETAHRRRWPLRVVDELVSRRAGTATLRGPALHYGDGQLLVDRLGEQERGRNQR